jgi:hypothetical protein
MKIKFKFKLGDKVIFKDKIHFIYYIEQRMYVEECSGGKDIMYSIFSPGYQVYKNIRECYLEKPPKEK